MPSNKSQKEMTEGEKLCKKLGVEPIIREKIKRYRKTLGPVNEDGTPLDNSDF